MKLCFIYKSSSNKESIFIKMNQTNAVKKMSREKMIPK